MRFYSTYIDLRVAKVLNIFRYKHSDYWHYIGDTNLIYNSNQNIWHNWYLVTESEVSNGEWYANAKGKPSVMLDRNLFDYHGLNYISNPVDEILERLPEEMQTEILFNLHLFTSSKNA